MVEQSTHTTAALAAGVPESGTASKSRTFKLLRFGFGQSLRSHSTK